MKKLFLFITIILAGIVAYAQPPAGDAKTGDFYGEKITAANAVDIASVPAKLDGKESFDTKIKAKVLDVCPKKGCWIKLAVDDKTTAFVKMKDYGFFVPEALKGKNIILDGEVVLKTTPVAELKHYAQDAKKSQAEIDAIKEPAKEIRFTARGILVVE
jgi:hypothetical protein